MEEAEIHVSVPLPIALAAEGHSGFTEIMWPRRSSRSRLLCLMR